MMFGASQIDDIEEDLGGHEDFDEEEDDDVPAANTLTDEDTAIDDVADDHGQWLRKASPFWHLMPNGE